MKSIQKDRLNYGWNFCIILVGKLKASVTFNEKWLCKALGKEQKHVDGRGMAYNVFKRERTKKERTEMAFSER